MHDKHFCCLPFASFVSTNSRTGANGSGKRKRTETDTRPEATNNNRQIAMERTECSSFICRTLLHSFVSRQPTNFSRQCSVQWVYVQSIVRVRQLHPTTINFDSNFKERGAAAVDCCRTWRPSTDWVGRRVPVFQHEPSA